VQVRLTKDNLAGYKAGYVASLSAVNLELIPEFRFADIREGDTIRRTFTRTDGSKVIWEGVADRDNYDGSKWLSANDYPLAYKADEQHPDIVIELIERPEPKHWAYTKPVGATALDKRHHTTPNTLRKTAENEWEQRFLLNGEAYLKTTESLAEDLRNLDPDVLEWLK
jgi:hypothetical protein